MPTSIRFRQLRSELRRLRLHLLPDRWDPTGSYSDRQLDRARAYRILAHAEIEAFIEDVALAKVEQRYVEWQTAQKPSYVIICVVAATVLGWADAETIDKGLPVLSLSKLNTKGDSINLVIDGAVKQYQEIVSNNNGIKSGNLKRLLMPIGIALSDLSGTWLNTMDSFGGRRGSVAHSSRVGLKSVPDPQDENATINLLLQGLKDLDTRIAVL
jgi:hypothetical protein